MGTEEIVIDSSAALAFLKAEPGGEALRDYFPLGLMSAVNAAEVVQILARAAIEPDLGLEVLVGLELRIVDADLSLARLAGMLEGETRNVGCSLGDRFCFALALKLQLKVVTADRAMSRVRLPVEIILIR